MRRCRAAALTVAMMLVAILFAGPAMAVEEPAFATVLQEGAFAVRDYPALIVAEVRVDGTQRTAASQGFRLLAGYIFGGNARRQSLPMTAPVAQERTPQTGAAAAGETWLVRFFMPPTATLPTLPAPDDPRVRLLALPAARRAVLRFSGWADAATLAAKSAELAALVSAHKLHAVGPVSLAQYDPPWTLWFMRRNEAMVTVTP